MEAEEFKYIKQQFEVLHKGQLALQGGQATITARLDKMEESIIGDERYGNEGLVNRMDKVEKYIDKDESLKNKIYGGFAIAVVLWGLIVEWLKSYFSRK